MPRPPSASACLLALLGAAACGPVEPPVPSPDPTPGPAPTSAFEDVSISAGLRSENRTQGWTGVAVGDVDGDGWPDLYVSGLAEAQGRPRGRLFVNRGDGTFADRTEAWGAAVELPPGREMSGVVFADFDGDGDPDLFIAAIGPDFLLRNDGDRFVDVSEASGLDPGADPTVALSLADFDGDGWLDVYGSNQVFPPPDAPWTETPDQVPARLMRGLPDGTFEDRSDWLPDFERPGAGYAAAWFDADGDGDPDLYVANDHGIFVQSNQLLRNDGPTADGWAFTVVSEACGCDQMIAAMGVTVGDYDRDLLPDLFVTNLAEFGGELLLQGQGDGTFVDTAVASGVRVGDPELRASSWGNEFLDFDNDGWSDLFVAYSGGPGGKEGPAPASNALLRNEGGSFVEVLDTGLDERTGPTLAATTLDFDLDGCMDLVSVDLHSEASLHRNRCGDGGWVGLHLEGTTSNRDAIGAVVELQADGWQRGEAVAGSSSMASGRWKAVHFGLGDRDSAEQVVIRWPSGLVETFGPLPGGRYHAVREGDGGPVD